MKIRKLHNKYKTETEAKQKDIPIVRCGVRTHAHFREPELKSGALDRSANLTWMNERAEKANFETRL